MALIPNVSIIEVKTLSTYVQEVANAGVVTSVEQTSSITVDSGVMSLIEVGIQGPPGPAGTGSSSGPETHYDQRSDVFSDTEVYRAEAAPGSLEGAPVWRIRRIMLSYSPQLSVTTKWAGATNAFTGVWSNRLTYFYGDL